MSGCCLARSVSSYLPVGHAAERSAASGALTCHITDWLAALSGRPCVLLPACRHSFLSCSGRAVCADHHPPTFQSTFPADGQAAAAQPGKIPAVLCLLSRAGMAFVKAPVHFIKPASQPDSAQLTSNPGPLLFPLLVQGHAI